MPAFRTRPAPVFVERVNVVIERDCIELQRKPKPGASREFLPDPNRSAYDEAMNYQGRIVIDPEIRFGKPCVRGTRITVGDVLSYLASGMREDQILSDFPQLVREDIRACLAFAAERERRIVSSPAA
jgi:uncharacterized protein (DUF433 family)